MMNMKKRLFVLFASTAVISIMLYYKSRQLYVRRNSAVKSRKRLEENRYHQSINIKKQKNWKKTDQIVGPKVKIDNTPIVNSIRNSQVVMRLSKNSNPIYLFRQYLDGDQLTIIGFESCNRNKNTGYSLVAKFVNGTSSRYKVKAMEVFPSCNYHSKKCTYGAYYFTATITKDIIPYLHTLVPLQVLQKADHYQFQLVVCAGLGYYFTDWTLIIQFMEIWQQLGAEKFYFYIQSYAPEVKTIFNVYQKEGLLQLIDWSVLPSPTKGQDPNYLVEYAGQVTADNDCLFRTRADKAKYVAYVDFDEMIIPAKYSKLTPFLDALVDSDEISDDEDNIGVMNFVSGHVKVSVPEHMTDSNDLSPINISLSSISLDYLNSVQIPDKGSETYLHFLSDSVQTEHRVKMVYKPEAIERMQGYKPYMLPGFKLIEVPEEKGFVYHMRRVIELEYELSWTESQRLAPFATVCTKQWKERVEKYGLTEKSLMYRGMKANEQSDECITNQLDHPESICWAVIKCGDNIKAVKHNEWIFVNNSWVVIK